MQRNMRLLAVASIAAALCISVPGSTESAMVADFVDEFQGPTPNTGWSYWWNAPSLWNGSSTPDGNGNTGEMGDSANYAALQWSSSDSRYTADGDGDFDNGSPARYLQFYTGGGHPGRGANQDEDAVGNTLDRYPIAAYTLQSGEDGFVRITASALRVGSSNSKGVEAAVYLGDIFVGRAVAPGGGHTIDFNLPVGPAAAGETIYVGLGPNGHDGSDSFSVDFTLDNAADAGTMIWDANGAADGFGGSGTWNQTASNNVWLDGGTSSYGPWANAANANAYFQGTAGTVTVGEAVTARSLSFFADGYTIDGTATINLTDSGSGGPGASTIHVAGGNTATINTPIGSSAGMTKTGHGNLELGGTATITGLTTIAADDLRLASGASLSVAGDMRVADGANATVDLPTGATLTVSANLYLGNTSGGTGTLNLDGGTLDASYVHVARGGDGSALNISGGQLNADDLGVGQSSQHGGAVEQTGGTVTLSRRLLLGHYYTATSTYTISDGTLELTGSTTTNPFTTGYNEQVGAMYIGVEGTGEFTQSGGEVSAQAMVLDNRTDTAGTDFYKMTGGTLTLGQWGIQGNTSTLVELGGGTVAASADWEGTLPMTLTGTNGNVTFDTAGHQITLSGALSGSGGLKKDGDGTLVLSGANTYDGETRISQGTVLVGGGAAGGTLGNGEVINYHTLDFQRTADLVVDNDINQSEGGQSGSIRQLSGSGQVTLAGTVKTSSLYLGSGNDDTAAALVLGAGSDTQVGSIRVGHNQAGLGTYGKLAVESTAELLVGYFGLGEQVGQTGLVEQNGGDVTVTNRLQVGHWPNNTSRYEISGGTLEITSSPGSNPFTSGNNEQVGVIYLGIDGTGEFVQSGGHVITPALVLDNRGNTTGTDFYKMTGGTLTLGQWGIQGNTSTLVELGGGTVAASADWEGTLPMTLTGTNGDVTFDTAGHQITLSGALSGPGGFVKTGAGTLVITNTGNTFSGDTTVSGGTLQLNDARLYPNGGWGDILVTIEGGGVVEVAGWADNDTLGIGKTSFDAANLVLDGGTIRYTGNSIAGNADRGFTIGAGGATLEAEGTNTWTLLKGRNFGITSAEGGTLTLAGSKDGELTIELGGSGGLVKSGSGTWTVGGANTYTGGTQVNEGTLLVNNTSGSGTGSGDVIVGGGAKLGGTGSVDGAVELSGIVSPGASVGTLSTGGQTWNDGSGFLFELADADDGAGTGWDLLSINGSLDLNGLATGGFTVTLGSLGSPIADFDPGATYEWEFVRTTDGIDGFQAGDFLVDGAALAGEFYAGSVLSVVQQGNSLYLSYSVPEPSALLLALLAAAGLTLGRRRRAVYY